MEAVRDFLPFQDTDQDTDQARGQATGQDTDQARGQAGYPGVQYALDVLQGVSSTAVADAAFWGFQAASDFAGSVEELSRTLEYLQVVAAAAVDRTRKQAAASAATSDSTGWAVGWTTGPTASEAAGSGDAARTADADSGAAAERSAEERSAVDDGYRNTAEFLRARLRISASEARRRLALGDDLLPRTGLGGQHLPAVREELGAAVASSEVASRAASIITVALDRVRHACDAEAAAAMEHALTRTAAENDPDFLARVARSWADALDQDGAEPSEELLRQLQGAFIRKPRSGLHHLEIFATAEQFENLLTVMNTATNPRTPARTLNAGAASPSTPDSSDDDAEGTAAALANHDPGDDPGTRALDRRSRPQKQLDGLVGACQIALAAGTLPAAGGLRPQVMVTIDYRDLLTRLERNTAHSPGDTPDSPAPAGPGTARTGTLPFTGPVTAATARKIACDADIVPVLLGGEGRILDIGRSSRIFPPHIRKALTARDLGCSFPGCTIPAPWCEAHHITYWSRGGTTGTDNGTLLCSHHHHIIHKEQWTIQLRTGIPWFIPPPHVDPRQRPRRNYYFHPTRPHRTPT